jgi:hypothetical protein
MAEELAMCDPGSSFSLKVYTSYLPLCERSPVLTDLITILLSFINPVAKSSFDI